MFPSDQIRLRRLLLRPVVASVILLSLAGWDLQSPVRIFLIGDSTMADKPVIDNPERGWGQLFPRYLNDNVIVENHARNGRSTKSFVDEGRWNQVYERIKPGDYVFIQFGHNDEKIADTARYAAPHGAYRQNLLRFVRDSRAQGGVPVLLTPIQRRKFNSVGRLEDTHGDYPDVVRDVAAAERVPLIDLAKMTSEFLGHIGPEQSKKVFLWFPDSTFDSFPGGKNDNTHFTEYGATEIAGLVAQSIQNSGLALKAYLRPFAPDSLPGLNKIVALDYFYNCEWKVEGATKTQFHYVWEDTANSGFSELGKTITDLGAYTTKVRRAPTLSMLSRYSVYVIVDPDTPSETDHPNYILADEADQIAQWVKAGGVLVLMGNDKGNAEFEHLNGLARHFGIRFNEDSYHRVVGKDFDSGKFVDLPGHPIFAGVKKIYMKEICSLEAESPATPVLTENGKVFIAISRFGRGLVLAVGDPWLYNEYFDSRKLPSDFENKKAGENMVRWLLQQANPVANNW